MTVVFKRAVLVLLLVLAGIPTAVAGGRSRTTYFNGTYLMGVYSLEEFNDVITLYPGIDQPTPLMTFYANGTVTLGTESATYKSKHGTITITYIPAPGSYFSTVQYILHPYGGDRYWGEILFDGNLYGIFDGQMTY